MTRVLGLTGGIATGKSTVVSIFRALGFPIVDGDEIARLIVQPGKPALAAIVALFGSTVLLENGELNRKKLGEMIFSNPPKREALDQLLDPYLREAILQQVAEKNKKRLWSSSISHYCLNENMNLWSTKWQSSMCQKVFSSLV